MRRKNVFKFLLFQLNAEFEIVKKTCFIFVTDQVTTTIEDLIQEYFEIEKNDANKCLELLGSKGMSTAVKHYIEKNEKRAVSTMVNKQLDKMIVLYFPQPRRLYSFPSTFSPVYWLGRRYNIFRLGKRYIVNMTCTFSPFYFFM